jgi:hypothetical protein
MTDASRRRQFIREHHPDRGGDPAAFIAGLRSFTGEAGQDSPLPRVIVVRRRSWPARLLSAVARRMRRGHRVPRVR